MLGLLVPIILVSGIFKYVDGALNLTKKQGIESSLLLAFDKQFVYV